MKLKDTMKYIKIVNRLINKKVKTAYNRVCRLKMEKRKKYKKVKKVEKRVD